MERELEDRINAMGMGPMGMGGNTYCLEVRIGVEPTHIAALPVAVNFCCHMLRHASAEL
jgi:fumarate hydratase subunit alpha